MYNPPTAKTTYILLLCTMWTILACMQTASPMIPTETDPAPQNTAVLKQSEEPESGAVFYLEDHLTAPAPLCAKVTADESLHLRASPNPEAEVRDYLKKDQVVTINFFGLHWWNVTTKQQVTGYARAEYLERSEC